MKRLTSALALVLFAATGCAAGGGPQTRTVLVDYSHDQFASFMIAYFPKQLTVAAGDTVVFRQTWTGEPHTVTGGTLVNEMMRKAKPFSDLFSGFEELMSSGAALPDPESEPNVPATEFFAKVDKAKNEPAKRRLLSAYDALRKGGLDLPDRENLGKATMGDIDKVITPASDKPFEETGVPWAFDENETGAFITQNAGQPCFLKSGKPPEKADQPCPDAQQRQPAFDDKATYYNSGIIPYAGAQGNTFRVKIGPNTKPGSYFFYCAVHGPGQSTEVKVRPKGANVPSQDVVSRQARKEIAAFARPMLRSYRDARAGRIEMDGKTIRAPFAGVSTEAHGSINTFVPSTLRTKVGERVTWKIMGADHTITFGVPKYFPIIQFRRNGTIRLNPRLDKPAGGSPPIPKTEGMKRVNGGTYDGSGFFSSGLFGGEPYAEYSLRFSKPGRYRYACLLHPPMVGTVVVSP